ncbi:hypothetical protein LXL04_023458 [Taraxacum kok-saghyz]
MINQHNHNPNSNSNLNLNLNPNPNPNPNSNSNPSPTKDKTISHPSKGSLWWKKNPFAVDCGVLTRKLISIKYTHWKNVPPGEKDNLWLLTIKGRWIIRDTLRPNVLISCSKKWRSFKKRLKTHFLDKHLDPLEFYSYLDPADLQIFQQRVSSAEFQVISEKVRESSRHNTNPAKLGPHGYRGNTRKWEEEIESGELEPELYDIQSERSRDYIMGRRSKTASGSKVIPPNMKPIVKKLVEVHAEILNGDVVPGPGEDLLTLVFGCGVGSRSTLDALERWTMIFV